MVKNLTKISPYLYAEKVSSETDTDSVLLHFLQHESGKLFVVEGNQVSIAVSPETARKLGIHLLEKRSSKRKRKSQ